MAAVGLGRGPADRRAAHAAVLLLAGLVAVPGGAARRGTRALGSLTACLDRALRIIGGAPAYLLTDNAKTVTVEHVAGIPVRHPDMVALGRHYGCTVQTCRPFDPESKGGTEATVKIAKADLVPAEANLREEYASFAELEADCEAWCERVNGRVHRESAAVPAQRLAAERAHLHPLPAEPYVLALGEERLVNEDQTVRFGSVRYSTPPGHAGQPGVVPGARQRAGHRGPRRQRRPGRDRPPPPVHARAIRGSATSTTRIIRAGTGRGSPGPRPRTAAEVAFLGLGEGAARWLTEAAAAGAQRVRSKMARAVELAAVVGAAPRRPGPGAGGDHRPVRRR